MSVDITAADAALKRMQQLTEYMAQQQMPALFTAMGIGSVRALTQHLNGTAGEETGKDLMSGLEKGIRNSQGSFVISLQAAAEAGARAAAQVLSPAVGLQIGSDFGRGIADGIVQMQSAVQQAAEQLYSVLSGIKTSTAMYKPAMDYGNTYTMGHNVMQDANTYARAVAKALNGISIQMDGQRVGNLVTPTVSRNIAFEAAMRG